MLISDQKANGQKKNPMSYPEALLLSPDTVFLQVI